ncbi:hypothetical protein D3C86_1065470 [compost metagenome]
MADHQLFSFVLGKDFSTADDLNRITRVRTYDHFRQTQGVLRTSHDHVFQGRNDFSHNTPEVERIAHQRDTAVRVDFGDQTLDEITLCVQTSNSVLFWRQIRQTFVTTLFQHAVQVGQDVRSGHGVFGSRDGAGYELTFNVGTVVVFDIVDRRDGVSTAERNQVTRRGTAAVFRTADTTVGEVVTLNVDELFRSTGVASPHLQDAAVFESDGSVRDHFPDQVRHRRFEVVGEPEETVVSVGNHVQRYVHVHTGTFR